MNRKYLWIRPGLSIRLCIGALAIVLLAAGLSSCEGAMQLIPPLPSKTPFGLTELPEGAVELSFETLGRDYSGALLSIRSPLLVVAANQAENQVWNDFFFPGVLDRLWISLQDVAFDSYFVFSAFQSYRGCIGPTVEIKQIIRQSNIVHVYAYFTEVLPQEPCRTEATSPYHLVKVRKEGNWADEFTFVLYDNDQPVAETKHFIP